MLSDGSRHSRKSLYIHCSYLSFIKPIAFCTPLLLLTVLNSLMMIVFFYIVDDITINFWILHIPLAFIRQMKRSWRVTSVNRHNIYFTVYFTWIFHNLHQEKCHLRKNIYYFHCFSQRELAEDPNFLMSVTV